ncbi:hypothetical protein RyT2_21540 [Pseudolactococcus yaeyamensis]
MVIDMKNIQLRKQYNQTIEKLQNGSQADKLEFLAQNRYFYDWKLEDIVFLHGQNPQSTAVKTFEDWQTLNVSVKSGQTASYLMLDRSDLLSKRISYFDVSQTTQGKREIVKFPLDDFYTVSQYLMQVDYSEYLEFGLEEFLRDFSSPVLENYEQLTATEKELVPLIATYTLSDTLGFEISSDTLGEIKKHLATPHNLMNVVKVANNLCVRIEQELTTGLDRIQFQSQKIETERQVFETQFLEELARLLSVSDISEQFNVTYNQAKNSMEIAYQGSQLFLTDVLEHTDFVAKYEQYFQQPLERLVDLEQLETELNQEEISLETKDDLFAFEVEPTQSEVDYALILEQFSDESRLEFLSSLNEEVSTYFQSTEFLLNEKVIALELKVYSPKGEVDELSENPQSPYIVEVWEDDEAGLQKLGILAYGANYTQDFSYFSNQLQSLEEGITLEQLLIESGETAYQFLVEETKQEQLEKLQGEETPTSADPLYLEKARFETLLAENGLQDTFSLDIEGENTLIISKISLNGVLETVQGEYSSETQVWRLKSQADERLKGLFTLSERLADIQAQAVTSSPDIQKEETTPIDELSLDEIYTKEIKRGTGTRNGKFPMQALFSEFPNMSKKEAQEVIRTFYSTTYGHSSSEIWVDHIKKGIDFPELGVVLSWKSVSEKVRELVINGEYLRNPQEATGYQAWLDDADTQYSSWHDYQDLKEKIQATHQFSQAEAINLFDDMTELTPVEPEEKTLEPLRTLDDLIDGLKHNEKLIKSSQVNDLGDFYFAVADELEKALVEHYHDNETVFGSLLENEQFNLTTREISEMLYHSLKDSQQLGFEIDTSHQKLVKAENENEATGKYYIQLSEDDDSYYIDEIRMGDVLIATNSTNVLSNAMAFDNYETALTYLSDKTEPQFKEAVIVDEDGQVVNDRQKGTIDFIDPIIKGDELAYKLIGAYPRLSAYYEHLLISDFSMVTLEDMTVFDFDNDFEQRKFNGVRQTFQDYQNFYDNGLPLSVVNGEEQLDYQGFSLGAGDNFPQTLTGFAETLFYSFNDLQELEKMREREVEAEKSETTLDTQEIYNSLFELLALSEYEQRFSDLGDVAQMDVEKSVKEYLDSEAYNAFGKNSFSELTATERREIAEEYAEQIREIAKERGRVLSESTEVISQEKTREIKATDLARNMGINVVHVNEEMNQSPSDKLFEDILKAFQKHQLGYTLRDNKAKNSFEISNQVLLLATIDYKNSRVTYLTDDKLVQFKELFSEHHLTEINKAQVLDKVQDLQPVSLKERTAELLNSIQDKLRTSELTFTLADDLYFIFMMKHLGNSHAFESLKDRSLEILSENRALFESIDDETEALYKEKGTLEQNTLYQLFKTEPIFARGTEISSRLVGEVSIAAYNVNHEIEAVNNGELSMLNSWVHTLSEMYIYARESEQISVNMETRLDIFPYIFTQALDEQAGDIDFSRDFIKGIYTRFEMYVLSDRQETQSITKAETSAFESEIIRSEVIEELSLFDEMDNQATDSREVLKTFYLELVAENSSPIQNMQLNYLKDKLYEIDRENGLNYTYETEMFPRYSTELDDAYKVRIDELLENAQKYDGTTLSLLKQWQSENISQVDLDTVSKEIIENVQDFSFPEDTSHFYPQTKDGKIKANLEAVRLVKQLEQEKKQAAPEQQEILAKYVGWGGLVDVFDERLEKYEAERLALQALVTKEEYQAMELSVLTAYYTEPHVVRAMFEKLEDMGFEGGRILEPSVATGNFLSAMPQNLRGNSEIVGVELDTITGSIAKQLHPNADIRIQGFETTNFHQGTFDLVVGNVPFSDLKIQGETDKKGYMIHDYFIQKSLSLTRENGIVALITSNGTMDKKNQSFRKELANQANFLGAVRLPNTAFSKLAGTKVTSDILFFQKTTLDPERYIRQEYRPEIEEVVTLENYPQWVTSGATSFSSEIALNTYFERNRSQILGKVKIQNYHGKTLTVVENGTPLEESLPRQLKKVGGTYQTGNLPLLEENLQENGTQYSPISEEKIAPFTHEIVEGKAYYRDAVGIEEVKVSGQQLSRLSGLIALRKAVQAVFETQTDINVFSESQYEMARLALNKVYDRFIEKYGVVHTQTNQTLFRRDDHYQLLQALEITKEEVIGEDILVTYEKAEIFEHPTIRKMPQLVTAQTALEALQLSLNHRGGVSLEFMAHVYPYAQEQILAELKGEIYFDPTREQWQSKAAYLSGNVRAKLEEAKQSLLDFPNDGFEENVQALEAVQPEWLPLEMIDYRLGSSWISWEIYQAFAKDVLDLEFSKKNMIRDNSDRWVLKDKGFQPKKSRAYSTNRVGTSYLLEKSLNQQFIEVRDKVTNHSGQDYWIFNTKETILAQEKQSKLQEAFKRYIETNSKHRQTLETTYNLTKNYIVLRQYDGRHLTFDSLNRNIELRPHQKDAVARIVNEQRGLLAHVVGSGKTLTMIASGMKLQELGMIQKPLYVVPNHLVGEFGSEILRAYPNKKVLTTTAKDFEKQSRKAFISRIATGTYDAIVMGMSQFERVPMSLEAQKGHLENQLSDVMAQIREGKQEDGERFTVKQALQTKVRIEAKLQKLIEGHQKRDTFIDFEELGVDFLFIDESHNFKNLFFQTKHSNVAGINSSASNRATDMYLKVRHIQEHHNGNNIVFATGTPISNSMAEMYTLMHYLEPDVLDEAGIHHFDKWASTFGIIEESVELNVEASKYRKKTRFSQFTNVPELMSLFSSVADVQTQEMLKLPVPEHTTHIVACPITEAQRVYMNTLIQRAEDIRGGRVEMAVDNMLKLCNDASKLALDPRLINPSLFDGNDSTKLLTCVDNVFQIWQDTSTEKSTQLIFSDLGTPQSNASQDKFSVYQAIKDDLIERGIPSEAIKFIHEANNDKKKERLFQDVRVGKVRVLLGSTQKLGTGTNIQDKLLAVHHLDVPWRPSDLEQRNGRVIRQGNENSHVHVFNYVTEGTFDAYRWQVVENKLKYITQVMTSKSPARSMEDVDEAVIDASEVKAIATGNPLLKERAMLENDVNRLKLLSQNYGKEQREWEKKVSTLPEKIVDLQEELKACVSDQTLISQRFSREEFVLSIQGRPFFNRDEAGLALLTEGREYAKSSTSSETKTIGEIAGLSIQLCVSTRQLEPLVQLIGEAVAYKAIDLNFDSPTGSIARIVNEVVSIQEGRYAKQRENQLTEVQAELVSAQDNLGKPFERADELHEKSHQLDRLTKAISLDMSLSDLEKLEKEVTEAQEQDERNQEVVQEM